MKSTRSIIALALIINLCGCTFSSHKQTSDEQTIAATPAPLKKTTSDSRLLSKRYDGNLLDQLYNDQVSKRPELKKLEDDIDLYKGKEPDSLEAFTDYLDKSHSYYASARNYIESISDSSLKQSLLKVIAASDSRFSSLVAGDTTKMNLLERKATTLKDYHTVLTVMTTLPVMEKYQQGNKPATQTLDQLLKEKQGLINRTQKLAQGK